jgi:hypothetical protein
MQAVVVASATSSPNTDIPPLDSSAAPFWWLLFHLELLILVPSTNVQREGATINDSIRDQISLFRGGDVERLYRQAFEVTSWQKRGDRPPRTDNRAAQAAANADNFRTAASRVCDHAAIAVIGPDNFALVQGLYSPEHPDPGLPFDETPLPQENGLPGDICKTICSAARGKGAGPQADTLDAFTDLPKQHGPTFNSAIRSVCDLIYRGRVPPEA